MRAHAGAAPLAGPPGAMRGERADGLVDGWPRGAETRGELLFGGQLIAGLVHAPDDGAGQGAANFVEQSKG